MGRKKFYEVPWQIPLHLGAVCKQIRQVRSKSRVCCKKSDAVEKGTGQSTISHFAAYKGGNWCARSSPDAKRLGTH